MRFQHINKCVMLIVNFISYHITLFRIRFYYESENKPFRFDRHKPKSDVESN